MIVSVEVLKFRTLRKPVSSALIMVLGLLLVIIIMAAGGLVSRWDVKPVPSTPQPASAYWQAEGVPPGTGHWQSKSLELSPEKREALRDDIIAIRQSLSHHVSEEKAAAP